MEMCFLDLFRQVSNHRRNSGLPKEYQDRDPCSTPLPVDSPNTAIARIDTFDTRLSIGFFRTSSHRDS